MPVKKEAAAYRAAESFTMESLARARWVSRARRKKGDSNFMCSKPSALTQSRILHAVHLCMHFCKAFDSPSQRFPVVQNVSGAAVVRALALWGFL